MAKTQKLRQSIRKGIIIFSFLLFPVTFFYLSPYLVFEGPLDGVIGGSPFMFIIFFLLSLFFGRIWCSWICPGGGISEIIPIIKNKKAKNGKFNLIKWIIWIPWLIAALSLTIYKLINHQIVKIDFFYMTDYGVSGVYLANIEDRLIPFIIYYIVISLFFFLPLIIGKRAFCHYICWMAPFMIIGRKIRNLFKWPTLKLNINNQKCINCKLCDNNCPMSLNVNEMVQKNKIEHSECILCGECIDNCPKDVIKYSFKAGR